MMKLISYRLFKIRGAIFASYFFNQICQIQISRVNNTCDTNIAGVIKLIMDSRIQIIMPTLAILCVCENLEWSSTRGFIDSS